jgi:hypothetical protein
MPQIDLSILNQRQTPAFYADTLANRPAAGFIGRIFVSTNTFELYRDNGTSWDLIGGPGAGTVTGSGAAGQVAFWNAASSIAGNNNLFWDNVNGHLGIGTNTPGTALGINHNQNQIIQLNQTTATNDTKIAFQNSGTPLWRIGNSYNAGANDFGVFDTVNSIQRLTIKNTGVSEFISNLSITKTGTATATTNTYGLFSNNSFIIPAGTNFSVSGSTYGSILGFYKATYGGNASYLNSQINAGLVSINQMEFSSTGTITMAQSTGVRATAAAIVQNQLTGTVNGTISHLAGLEILGNFKGGTGLLTVTNAYGLLVNNLDDYSSGFTYTNRWGIYQDGASDRNYFAGNTLIGTTTDSGEKLQVNGRSLLNGNVEINSGAANNYDLNIFNTTPRIQLQNAASGTGVNDGFQIYQLSTATYILNKENDYFFIGTNDSVDLSIAPNGNFGVGISAPTRRLHISAGGSDCAIRLDNTVSGRPFIVTYSDTENLTFINSSDSGYIAFNTTTGASLERLRITNGGNILIGTTTDAGQKLQVNGTATIRDTVRVTASSTTSVSTSATIISTGSNTYGGMAIIWGVDGGGNIFSDFVYYSLGTFNVLASQNVSGAPALRTYSVSGSGDLRLTMALGTYTVRYQALLTV